MIIDFQADPRHAELYDIVDAATGRSMADQPIFYADDETGIYRVYLTDIRGDYYTNPSNPDEMAQEKRRGAFRLVLKGQSDEAAATPERAETWRTKNGLL